MAHLRLVKKFNNLPALRQKVDPAAAAMLRAWALDTEIIWESKMISSPPTGRTYYDRKRPSPHIASSAGNPPRVWTGDYLGSVRVERTNKLSYETMTDSPYAGELEYAMDRPVMEPTAAEAEGRSSMFIDAFTIRLL